MIKKLSPYLAAFALTVFMASCADEEPTPADDRDKFVGSFTCQENSQQNGNSTFTIHVNKSASSETQIEIENFYNLGFQNKATASVSGGNFTIASQLFSGNTISGSGSSTGSTTFTMTYYVNDGSTIDTCSATCTKQ
ncbi:MAG: hypothetical protein AB1458_04900 [Bacteroidota bacterium]